MDEHKYVFSNDDDESDRLRSQGELLAPHSEHMFRQAGIESGMRVLDIGCGTGETSRLLGEVVGPAGSVIGVDQDPGILGMAERVTSQVGLANVSYVKTILPDIHVDGSFDAVTGRLILMHVANPLSILRSVVERVRPGGIVTFQEPVSSRSRTVPEVPTVTRWRTWFVEGLRGSGLAPDIGDELPQLFRQVGLTNPSMAIVELAGDADSIIPTILTATMAQAATAIVASGAATAEEINADVESRRLHGDAKSLNAMVCMVPLACVWASKPAPENSG